MTKIIAALGIILAGLAGLVLSLQRPLSAPVLGNALTTATGVSTASATTSPNYMVPGIGTTTLTYDSFVGGSNTLADKAALLVQFAGSSTLAQLNINTESSINNVDWFANGLLSLLSTTTGQVLVSATNTAIWTFASSTQGFIGFTAGNTATTSKIFFIDTPTRYTRVIFSSLVASSSVWATIQPIKQRP